MQRVVVSASYSGKLSYIHDEMWDIKRTDEILKNAEESDYSDAVTLAGDLYLSPNTGFIASSSIQFTVGYALIYRPHPAADEKRVLYTMRVGANY